jgi:DNA modification methylase
MAGTGSTLIAALRIGRRSYGIELNPGYAEIGRQVISDERQQLGVDTNGLTCEMITGDATKLADIVNAHEIPKVDYILTSPPYWDMLHSRGADTQRTRRATHALDVIYSNDPQDLGNIKDYDEFLDKLAHIFIDIKSCLMTGGYLTIIVKNIKKGGKIYPLAWDLAGRLRGEYTLKDEKIWCQDNQRLSPFGLGNAWVSNTFHHYCLQLRKE